ncbi:MAG: twin-arginine translocase TatA/TatE family subunit, partial [Steroidobacteraceae bacterium]
MFDIGFSEVLLIFGLALVVLGPDKLPGVART